MEKNQAGFRIATLSVILALAVLPTACIAAGLCDFALGDHVVLTSDTVDPNVFVWDARGRLIDYAAGSWGSTKEIVVHTTLVEPGTQAMVTSCHHGDAHPKYEPTAADVIGVRILTGRHRSLYGWVISSDVHAMRADEGLSEKR